MLASWVFAPRALALDISFAFPVGSSDLSYVSIRGSIEEGDCQILSDQISKEVSSGRLLEAAVLRSPGGSLYEGLCIGRLVRRLKLIVIAPSLEDASEGEICASACAIVWLGGVRRLGAAYAHHPYVSPGTTISFDEMRIALDAARLELTDFIDEMNLESTIGDRFLSARSYEIIPLSAKDLGIEYDPIVFEFIVGECGAPLKATENEILRFLEDNIRLDLNADDPVYQYAFEFLSSRKQNWNLCRNDSIAGIQAEAQFHSAWREQ